jgi:hypothetical protein
LLWKAASNSAGLPHGKRIVPRETDTALHPRVQQNISLRRRKEWENSVRSELIFRAKETVANKYKLCQTASKATRRLHIASRNTPDTINNAFVRIADGFDIPLSVELSHLLS